MEPGQPMPPVGKDPQLLVATRTILELIAVLMDAAFARLGEGTVLGTMPPYLQAFGAQNARYLDRHYGPFHAGDGAVAALAPSNFVSQVTRTPYTLVDATTQHAVKRLQSCEFMPAFAHKSPFARTMICQLHRAAYQGSANALLPPGHPGYDITLESRILFGDPHCDFGVIARTPPPAPAPQSDRPPKPDVATQPEDTLAFYTAILVAFVDYLSTVLPQAQLHDLLIQASEGVGTKLHHVHMPRVQVADATQAEELVAAILGNAGRTLAPLPLVQPSQGIQVQSCALSHPIRATTKARGPQAPAVRAAVCRLCQGVLQGAVEAARPGLRVERTGALTLGDPHCHYRIEESTP